MAIRDEFVMFRRGKDGKETRSVLYAGVLALAHEEGLVSITTEIIQLPSDENGQTAVMMARVTMERDGKERTFTGVGDANPRNVPGHIALHTLRMAETRAKARALRDAVNVGEAALEEFGDDDEPPARAGNGHSKAPVPVDDLAALRAEYRAEWKRLRDAGEGPAQPEGFEAWDAGKLRREIAAMREYPIKS